MKFNTGTIVSYKCGHVCKGKYTHPHTCIRAVDRPPVRVVESSGRHTPYPSTQSGTLQHDPPMDYLLLPTAPHRLEHTHVKSYVCTLYPFLGCVCVCMRAWMNYVCVYLCRGCRIPQRLPYGHSCVVPSLHEDTGPRRVHFRYTLRRPIEWDLSPVRSGPMTRPSPHP